MLLFFIIVPKSLQNKLLYYSCKQSFIHQPLSFLTQKKKNTAYVTEIKTTKPQNLEYFLCQKTYEDYTRLLQSAHIGDSLQKILNKCLLAENILISLCAYLLYRSLCKLLL